ncbi:MAG: hypothetical protein LBK41_02310 [Clostridiales bacterium]|jgi:hypothetical protein|nr:hypothetical protein [Clostridiales bacterium]
MKKTLPRIFAAATAVVTIVSALVVTPARAAAAGPVGNLLDQRKTLTSSAYVAGDDSTYPYGARPGEYAYRPNTNMAHWSNTNNEWILYDRAKANAAFVAPAAGGGATSVNMAVAGTGTGAEATAWAGAASYTVNGMFTEARTATTTGAPTGTVKFLWDGPTLYALLDMADTTSNGGAPPDTTAAGIGTSSNDYLGIQLDLRNEMLAFETDTTGWMYISGASTTNGTAYTSFGSGGMIAGNSPYNTNHPWYNGPRIKAYAVENNTTHTLFKIAIEIAGWGSDWDFPLTNGTEVGLELAYHNGGGTAAWTLWSAKNYVAADADTAAPNFNNERSRNRSAGIVTLTGAPTVSGRAASYPADANSFAYSAWAVTQDQWFWNRNDARYGLNTSPNLWTPDSRDRWTAAYNTWSATENQANMLAALKAFDGLRWYDTRFPDPRNLPAQQTLPNPYEFVTYKAAQGEYTDVYGEPDVALNNGIGEGHDGKVLNNADWFGVGGRREEVLKMAQMYEYGLMPEITVVSTAKNGNNVTGVVKYNGGANQNITVTLGSASGVSAGAFINIGSGLTVPNSITMTFSTTVTDTRNNVVGSHSSTVNGYANDYQTANGYSNIMGPAISLHAQLEVLEAYMLSHKDDDLYKKCYPIRATITGFSINGKVAFACALFDERVYIAVPGASGASGAGLWRYSNYGQAYNWTGAGYGTTAGYATDYGWGNETLSAYTLNLGRENHLFAFVNPIGSQSRMYNGSFGFWNHLPYDKDELIATFAPDRMVIVGNTSINDHNDNTLQDAAAASMAKAVYRFLGPSSGYDPNNYVGSSFVDFYTAGDPHRNNVTGANAQIAKYAATSGVGNTTAPAEAISKDPFGDRNVSGAIAVSVTSSKGTISSVAQTMSAYDYYYGGYNTMSGGTGGRTGRDGWYYAEPEPVSGNFMYTGANSQEKFNFKGQTITNWVEQANASGGKDIWITLADAGANLTSLIPRFFINRGSTVDYAAGYARSFSDAVVTESGVTANANAGTATPVTYMVRELDTNSSTIYHKLNSPESAKEYNIYIVVSSGAKVSGRITGSPGAVNIAGASVTLRQGDAVIGSAATSGDGTYTISGVGDGTGYTIEVSADGYAGGATAGFAVSGADVTGQNLVLSKQYAIDYVLDGGTLADGAPAVHTYGAATDLPSASKTGYGAVAWYGTPALTGTAYTRITAAPQTELLGGDVITVYAKYALLDNQAVLTESLTFTATDGYASIPAQNLIFSNVGGNQLTITSVTRDGDSFSVGAAVPVNPTSESSSTIAVTPVTGLAVGSHTGSVTVVSGAGSKTAAITINIVPSAPELVSAEGTGVSRRVMLTWTAVPGAEWYEYSNDAGDTWMNFADLQDGYNQVADNGDGTLSAVTGRNSTGSDMTNGTLYAFIVRAAAASGGGPASNGLAARPSAPQAGRAVLLPTADDGHSLAGGNGTLSLSWVEVSGNVSGYQYQTSADGVTWPETWTQIPGASSQAVTSGAITGLTNGTLYYVRVRASSETDEPGDPSNIRSGIPKNVNADGSWVVTFSLNTPGSSNTTLTHWRDDSDASTPWPTTGGSNTTYAITITPETYGQYKALPSNRNVISEYTTATNPDIYGLTGWFTAATGGAQLNVTPTETATVYAQWLAPNGYGNIVVPQTYNFGTFVVGYADVPSVVITAIHRSYGTGTTNKNYTASWDANGTNNYDSDGPATGTYNDAADVWYYYDVSPKLGKAAGTYTGVLTTKFGDDTNALRTSTLTYTVVDQPAVSPANVSASATGTSGQLAVSWTAPAAQTGLTITGYQYSIDGGTSWVKFAETSAAKLSGAVDGLADGAPQTVRVRAMYGDYAYSQAGSASGTPYGTYHVRLVSDVALKTGQDRSGVWLTTDTFPALPGAAAFADTDLVFRGWFDAETGGNAVTAFPSPQRDDEQYFVLYARFTEPVFSIAIDVAGDGTSATADFAITNTTTSPRGYQLIAATYGADGRLTAISQQSGTAEADSGTAIVNIGATGSVGGWVTAFAWDPVTYEPLSESYTIQF